MWSGINSETFENYLIRDIFILTTHLTSFHRWSVFNYDYAALQAYNQQEWNGSLHAEFLLICIYGPPIWQL